MNILFSHQSIIQGSISILCYIEMLLILLAKPKNFWNALEGSSHCYDRRFIIFEKKYAVCNH